MGNAQPVQALRRNGRERRQGVRCPQGPTSEDSKRMALPNPHDPEIRIFQTTRRKANDGTNTTNLGEDSDGFGGRGGVVVIIIHTITSDELWQQPQVVQKILVVVKTLI